MIRFLRSPLVQKYPIPTGFASGALFMAALLAVLSLAGCAGKDDVMVPEDDTSVDTAGDTSDTGACLILDPDTLTITPDQMNGFVSASGCTDGLAVECTEPYRSQWSETDGAWLVAVDPVSQVAPTSGTCVFTSTGGSATLEVTYTP